MTALLGRNGVGKTTTLRALLGLVPRAGTRAPRPARDITREPTHRIVRRGVGYVPEDRDVFAGADASPRTSSSPCANGRARYDLVYELFPELEQRARAARGHALGRPAADGRDRARAAERERDPARRRADQGPRADDRDARSREALERVCAESTVLLVEQNLDVVRRRRRARRRARHRAASCTRARRRELLDDRERVHALLGVGLR